MPEVHFDLKRIPYVWSSLTRAERQSLLDCSPLAAPLVSSLTWLRKFTKTWDEHDIEQPYKPFPDWNHFDVLHHLWMAEPKLFIEKSRTVMATWWGAGECLHYVMTHQPASAIFWCPDQDRAEKCIKYCKVLYAQQDDRLKAIYALPRKKKTVEDQSVYKFELGDGGWLQALPGKNPDKIRSEHPTLVMMDECCFNPEGAEAYDNALATRPLKLLCVSSAAPSWFRDLTEAAGPIPLPELSECAA